MELQTWRCPQASSLSQFADQFDLSLLLRIRCLRIVYFHEDFISLWVVLFKGPSILL